MENDLELEKVLLELEEWENENSPTLSKFPINVLEELGVDEKVDSIIDNQISYTDLVQKWDEFIKYKLVTINIPNIEAEISANIERYPSYLYDIRSKTTVSLDTPINNLKFTANSLTRVDSFQITSTYGGDGKIKGILIGNLMLFPEKVKGILEFYGIQYFVGSSKQVVFSDYETKKALISYGRIYKELLKYINSNGIKKITIKKESNE